MSNGELIERGREMCGRLVGTPDWHTAHDLLDALEAAGSISAALRDEADSLTMLDADVIDHRLASTLKSVADRIEDSRVAVNRLVAVNESLGVKSAIV